MSFQDCRHLGSREIVCGISFRLYVRGVSREVAGSLTGERASLRLGSRGLEGPCGGHLDLERKTVEEACASSRTGFLGQRSVQPHRAPRQTAQRGLTLRRRPLRSRSVMASSGTWTAPRSLGALAPLGSPHPGWVFSCLLPCLGPWPHPVSPLHECQDCCHPAAPGHGRTRGQGGHTPPTLRALCTSSRQCWGPLNGQLFWGQPLPCADPGA